MKEFKAFAVGLFNFITNGIMWFPNMHLRKLYLKIFIKHIGKRSSFMRNVEIRKPININIGDNVIINQHVLLDARGGNIIIGNNVDVAQETNIWTLEHNPHDDYHSEKRGDVIIEDYVWIASRCTILPGVRIGYGAVVATGAVVTKDVLPYSIVGGIPARFLSKRQSNLKYNLTNKSWFR